MDHAVLGNGGVEGAEIADRSSYEYRAERPSPSPSASSSSQLLQVLPESTRKLTISSSSDSLEVPLALAYDTHMVAHMSTDVATNAAAHSHGTASCHDATATMESGERAWAATKHAYASAAVGVHTTSARDTFRSMAARTHRSFMDVAGTSSRRGARVGRACPGAALFAASPKVDDAMASPGDPSSDLTGPQSFADSVAAARAGMITMPKKRHKRLSARLMADYERVLGVSATNRGMQMIQPDEQVDKLARNVAFWASRADAYSDLRGEDVSAMRTLAAIGMSSILRSIDGPFVDAVRRRIFARALEIVGSPPADVDEDAETLRERICAPLIVYTNVVSVPEPGPEKSAGGV
jgi:hypothetical protein